MVSKVAVVELGQDVKRSFRQALRLIGGLGDLNAAERSVVIKVGLFDPRTDNHASVDVVDAIIGSFSRASRIFLAESDNRMGSGEGRLQKWKTLFSKRVMPFNLSEDEETEQVRVAGEEIQLSHILFKPNVFVSTHIMRIYEHGSILKNLLGLIPDKNKARFHGKMVPALLDLYEGIGGIDLAVLDGAHMSLGVSRSSGKVDTDVLLVGWDAIAVEAIGAVLVGSDPEKMPVISEAVNRGLGEGDISNIEVVGASFDSLKAKFKQQLAVSGSKKNRKASAKTDSIQSNVTRFSSR